MRQIEKLKPPVIEVDETYDEGNQECDEKLPEPSPEPSKEEIDEIEEVNESQRRLVHAAEVSC